MDVNDVENDQNLLNKSDENVLQPHKEVIFNKDKSETDDTDEETEVIKSTKITRKRAIFMDSDNDDEPSDSDKIGEGSTTDIDGFGAILSTTKTKETVTSINDNVGSPPANVTNNMKSYLKLCDSESSCEEPEDDVDNKSPIIPQKPISKSGKYREKVNQPKKMTAQEALKQRKEIRSESQRMTREMNVSLPYHRPKTRTLKEFLEQRPKFSTLAPAQSKYLNPAIALRMNKEQLKVLGKKLTEREKQMEEYFKSDDEQTDETEVEKEIQISEKEAKSNEQEAESREKVSENKKEAVNDDKSKMVEIFHESYDKEQEVDKSLMDADETINNDIKKESLINSIEDQNGTPISDMEVVDNTESNNKRKDDMIDNKTRQSSANIVLLENILIQEPVGDTSGILLKHNPDVVQDNPNIKNEQSTTIKSDTLSKVKNIKELIKEKFGNTVPKLTKSEDFIDLDENVNELKNRFLKHTVKKQPHKHNVHLDIVSVTNGEIRKEKLEITVEDETIPIIEKPGERLKKLKNELQNKIVEEQAKLWKERTQTKDSSEVEKVKDIESEDENDILDKADEEEFTEIEDDEDGDEVIGDDDDGDDNEEADEDDNKNEFLENQAEESGKSSDSGSDVNDEDGISDEEMDDDDNESEKNLDADDEDEQQNESNQKRKKKHKRIIQVFENDSDDETDGTTSVTNVPNKNFHLDTTETMDDLSAPTPHQKRNDHTPVKYNTQTKSELGFLTPVIQLTGLQSFNTGSEFLRDSPGSPFVLPANTPEKLSQSGPQKKLFADDNVTESQMLDDLEDMCSGKFTTQSQSVETTNTDGAKTEVFDEPSSTTQELLEICSGKFTGITQSESAPGNNIAEAYPRCTTYTSIKISNDEIKNFDDKDDEKLIFELLEEDEEELATFKKKFESPQKVIGGKILDSDEEIENVNNKKKKARNFIVDEDDDEIQNNCNEENDENYDDDSNQDDLHANAEGEDVEYDSEENEITANEKKEKLKMADFFEEEAELTESEWGSADEDEKDIDVLEFEEGDKDKLDERKVKRDLERIHMRRILDDDNHEVKMLQEILLDDGELHGKGRERRFKWRNIDNSDNNEDTKRDDDGEVYLDDDDENEQEWRKRRHEREVFLKKHKLEKNDESTEIESSSQIFKLGQVVIKRPLSNTPNNSTHNDNSNSPDFKSTFSLVNKRGSFLSRSDQVLARVAEITSKTVKPTIGGAKHSRNFVFHTVQRTGIESEEQNGKKRKAEDGKDGTPFAIKKLRLNNVSPAIKKKVEKTGRAKSLFANW